MPVGKTAGNTLPLALLLACALLVSGCATQPPEKHITRPDEARLADESAPPPFDAARTKEEQAARLAELREANANAPMELDAYGGWRNAPESLGPPQPGDYFRLAKRGGAWWFITPDGHHFVSKGVTDVNWIGAGFVGGPFHDLLVAKYGTEEAWAAASQERALDWGFNTIGPWSSASMAQRMTHAVIILDVGGAGGPRHPKAVVTDYWDPAFAEHAAAMAAQRAAPHAEDRNLIGYFLDNEIVWGADHFLTKRTLVQLYLAFSEGAPGRAEAIRFLRDAAGTVAAFNETWGTELRDWDGLSALNPGLLRPKTDAAHAVTEAFMLAVFDQYANTAIAALRAADPNHLILGCRFHNYPGDALFEAAAKHFDVISMAFYEARPPVQELDAISQLVDKPALIEEWTFKSDESGIVNPHGFYGPVVPTDAARGLAYDNYVETFMRRPYAVGYHWYKWMDNPVLPDKRYSGDNCGLLNANDEPYTAFVEHAREVNRRVEHWHAAGKNAES